MLVCTVCSCAMDGCGAGGGVMEARDGAGGCGGAPGRVAGLASKLEDVWAAGALPASWRRRLCRYLLAAEGEAPYVASRDKSPGAIGACQEVLDAMGVRKVREAVGALRRAGHVALSKRVQRLSKARNYAAHPDPSLLLDARDFVQQGLECVSGVRGDTLAGCASPCSSETEVVGDDSSCGVSRSEVVSGRRSGDVLLRLAALECRAQQLELQLRQQEPDGLDLWLAGAGDEAVGPGQVAAFARILDEVPTAGDGKDPQKADEVAPKMSE